VTRGLAISTLHLKLGDWRSAGRQMGAGRAGQTTSRAGL